MKLRSNLLEKQIIHSRPKDYNIIHNFLELDTVIQLTSQLDNVNEVNFEK